MDVTTWYLEQTSPGDLVAAKPPRLEIEVVRAEIPNPEFSRFLYTAVGGDWHWTDRLAWSYGRWTALLERPGFETWVAWHRGTPAGFAELEAHPEGEVEITSFGLLPWAIGQGLGGHLLHTGTARAWDLASRWPGLPGTRRVWLHTCTLDGPHALANYRARGFRVYQEKLNEPGDRPEGPTPGPWPGARG
ncbi:GNAT family N-acetyltransferase [Nonomuraea sp. NPDC050328]|uniref:GNAT family N-acetyltransferase n=1 Tax=Nonomuraea sp. NPDC050328 TaxID=3364361 RepID=UPI0037AB51E3